MESKLKVKSPSGASVEIAFDPNFPVVLEVDSVDTQSTVTVKDPSGLTSTVKFIGGRERRG